MSILKFAKYNGGVDLGLPRDERNGAQWRGGRMCSQATRSASAAVARIVLTMLRLGAAAIFLQKNSATLERQRS
eukprot:2571966-Pleurochrysis_carterae.AAC.1